jgi:two-component system OmpR family sensor kinase
LIDQIQWEYSDKNVKLKVSLPSYFEKEVHVQWLESIFSNLIRNAFKYVNDGWEIKISLKENEFSIWNSWDGIKKDNLDKIWERFWQWDTSHADAKSFWLWLYLSKLFAEKQGFDLWCDSKEWKWVTFTLKFN